jgi:glycosyltransferase involved in cell wall biosynthesis
VKSKKETNHRTLVIIPAFNEEGSLSDVVIRTLRAGFDCLVIDDGSIDKTAAVGRAAGAYMIQMPFNVGIGGALRCGFKWAVRNGYTSVVQCDADGQHSPELISKLITCREESGAHLVIGSRFRESTNYSVGAARGFLMKRMATRASKAAGITLTDTTSGFRCISQPLLGEFANNYPVEYMESFEALIVAASAGYAMQEVACEMSHRVAGIPSNRPVQAAGFTIRVLLGGLLGTRFKIMKFNNQLPT